MTHAFLGLLLLVAGTVAGGYGGYRVGLALREPCVCQTECVP